ncbi:MAG: Na+/H+ antiporter NhaA [Gemmatimonadetes bacterium]|nr:Na+/H+ antiporter NhaA [Gemmatimonadota bacterium]MYB60309.1 Na+/H+ antiporter NhaA [Gemmatimonadota bacterium]
MSNQKLPFIDAFLRLESASGILLMLATALALIFANSFLEPLYHFLLNIPIQIHIAALDIHKPLQLWINDGLMAIFFFLVGLELKREFLEGELSDRRNIVLPGVGAVGGMIVPALIYFIFNSGDPDALRGWAVPVATDIAFALGVLALLGSRVPISIKVFLTSLAILDDIGAIAIIAVFYAAEISIPALLVAAGCVLVLFFLNNRNWVSHSSYMMVGVVLWIALLKSGVHATLAGVILAVFIPMQSRTDPDVSPLKILEHDLHTVVAFVILPVFAFANAGISFEGMTLDQVLHNVPVGVALGLFLGKQIGIFGLCWMFVRFKWASLPTGMTWTSIYGASALCGIGFTMSLFIGSLAFAEIDTYGLFDERLGIMAGSLLSGVLGYIVLRNCLPPTEKKIEPVGEEVERVV